MDNWDDDDFDIVASAQTKLADLGLDAPKKAAAAASSSSAEGVSSSRQAELEGIEAAKEADLAASAALLGELGLVKTKVQTFETLKTLKQFERYGNEQGELFASRAKDPNYMAFFLPLIKLSTAKLTRLQLEEVQSAINEHLSVFVRKEAEAKKIEEEKKKLKEKKKQRKRLEEDDMIVDEYADYVDNYE